MHYILIPDQYNTKRERYTRYLINHNLNVNNPNKIHNNNNNLMERSKGIVHQSNKRISPPAEYRSGSNLGGKTKHSFV